jgi:hypothetical protein
VLSIPKIFESLRSSLTIIIHHFIVIVINIIVLLLLRSWKRYWLAMVNNCNLTLIYKMPLSNYGGTLEPRSVLSEGLWQVIGERSNLGVKRRFMKELNQPKSCTCYNLMRWGHFQPLDCLFADLRHCVVKKTISDALLLYPGLGLALASIILCPE